MKSVTLKDVASEAGVAKSVASVVLRGLPESKKYLVATQQRVIEAAEKLEYRPNFFASQLMPGKQRLMVLGLRYLQDSYASVIAEAYEKRAREHGFQVLLSVLHDEGDPAEFSREFVGKHGVTNAAYIGDVAAESQEALVNDGVNVVLIGRKTRNPNISTVTADNYKGGMSAAKHLYDQGIKKLLVFSSVSPGLLFDAPSADWDGRIAAVMDYARDNGLPEPELRGFPAGQAMIRHVYEALKQLLAQRPDTEGILAYSDTFALAAISALNELGLRAGHDVAVVGYDDSWHSSLNIPAITTVHQPMEEMGRIAADLLIQARNSNDFKPQQIVLPTELIVRESSLFCKTRKT